MKKLTPTQQRVYDTMGEKPHSSYTLGVSLATMRALVKQGRCKDVTTWGPGELFSPRTHYMFIRIPPK